VVSTLISASCSNRRSVSTNACLLGLLSRNSKDLKGTLSLGLVLYLFSFSLRFDKAVAFFGKMEEIIRDFNRNFITNTIVLVHHIH
jgi:hypothetical protein